MSRDVTLFQNGTPSEPGPLQKITVIDPPVYRYESDPVEFTDRVATSLARWMDTSPATAGVPRDVQMSRLKDVLVWTVPPGELFIGDVAAGPVRQVFGQDGELLPVPEGYLRFGTCAHWPNTEDVLPARFDPPPGFEFTIAHSYPSTGILVRSTLHDDAGPVYVVTSATRVRLGRIEVPFGSGNVEADLVPSYDTRVGYKMKIDIGGPGWARLMAGENE